MDAEAIANMVNREGYLHRPLTPQEVERAEREYETIEILGFTIACGRISRVNWFSQIIRHVAVRRGLRRLGFGTRLLKRLLDRSEKGIVFATVHKDNTAACKLFEKVGFIPTLAFESPLTGKEIILYQILGGKSEEVAE